MESSVQQSSLDLATRLGVLSRRCRIVARRAISPSLVEVVLRGDAASLAGVAGNDVMVLVSEGQGELARRRYSVRAVSEVEDTFTLWISTNHQGPGAQWAERLYEGDEVDVVGPRGKITLSDTADWHLFVGDVSALGAFYRMAQNVEVPGRCVFVVELDDPSDALTVTFDPAVGVTAIFVDRQGRAYNDPAGLLSGLAALTLPPDEGHAYLFGEFLVTRTLRSALVDRGLRTEQISLKAYYRVGQGNGANGEPSKDL